jgi:hypothetical protein
MPQHAAEIIQLSAKDCGTGHPKPGLSSLVFSWIWIGGDGLLLFHFSCDAPGVDTGWEQ